METKCPLCKIGFYLMCSSPQKAEHMDITWTSEAGMTAQCKDLEAVKPHIVENKNYGTGYSLDEETQKWFDKQSEKFLADPTGFSKENVAYDDFATLLGTVMRYSDYMENRLIKEGLTHHDVGELFNKGLDIREVLDEVTEVAK